jgi:sugar lactone lactonase YvrE
MSLRNESLLLGSLAALAMGCSPAAPAPLRPEAPAAPVATVEGGFAGPESVRYDPEQDVYFVSNFNGAGGAADNNGFISRVRPDGGIEQLRFVAGGANGVTLHAPRGMTLVGDTLWAADVGAVRGFHRRTGAPLATVDFTALEPGFLNDITPGPGGALYVTDTGKNRVYRIAGGVPSILVEDTVLSRPNGITWDARANRLVVLPFGGKQVLLGMRPSAPGLEVVATGPGGRYDGAEILRNGAMLVSSQADSTLVWFVNGEGSTWVRTAGAPADIGVDTRRGRVAVPFLAMNRVDIWQLPLR